MKEWRHRGDKFWDTVAQLERGRSSTEPRHLVIESASVLLAYLNAVPSLTAALLIGFQG